MISIQKPELHNSSSKYYKSSVFWLNDIWWKIRISDIPKIFPEASDIMTQTPYIYRSLITSTVHIKKAKTYAGILN